MARRRRLKVKDGNKLVVFIRNNYIAGIFSILSIFIGILIEKSYDKMYPEDPIIVKELKDSIQVLHSINLKTNQLNTIAEDSLGKLLLEKLDKLDRIKRYEEVINKKVAQINTDNRLKNATFIKQYYNSTIDPSEVFSSQRKGVILHSLADTDLMLADCPKFNDDFFDISFQFSDTTVFERTACIVVQIRKEQKIGGKTHIEYANEKYYKAKNGINILRINSPFNSKGTYSISFGLILKKDSHEEYPEFHRKTCFVNVI